MGSPLPPEKFSEPARKFRHIDVSQDEIHYSCSVILVASYAEAKSVHLFLSGPPLNAGETVLSTAETYWDRFRTKGDLEKGQFPWSDQIRSLPIKKAN